MKTIDKTKLEKYFTSYCSKDALRLGMMKPGIVNGFAFATDAHRMIRMKLSDIDFEIEGNNEFPHVEYVWNAIIETDPFEISAKEIKELIKGIPVREYNLHRIKINDSFFKVKFLKELAASALIAKQDNIKVLAMHEEKACLFQAGKMQILIMPLLNQIRRSLKESVVTLYLN